MRSRTVQAVSLGALSTSQAKAARFASAVAAELRGFVYRKYSLKNTSLYSYHPPRRYVLVRRIDVSQACEDLHGKFTVWLCSNCSRQNATGDRPPACS